MSNGNISKVTFGNKDESGEELAGGISEEKMDGAKVTFGNKDESGEELAGGMSEEKMDGAKVTFGNKDESGEELAGGMSEEKMDGAKVTFGNKDESGEELAGGMPEEKMDGAKVTFTNNLSVEDYNSMRSSVNWIKVNEKRASIALAHSFYLCVALYEEKPVGMARIVSDGGYTYFITDVIVRPEYQGLHIGTQLIARVLDYIEKDVTDGETVMVSLMAAFERESFYERFGFHTRPFGNHGPGMSMWVSRDISGKLVTV